MSPYRISGESEASLFTMISLCLGASGLFLPFTRESGSRTLVDVSSGWARRKARGMKFGLMTLLVVFFLPNVSLPSMRSSRPACKKNQLFKAQHIVAWSTPTRARGFFYKSGLAIDADGAFRAYHPNDGLGLDSLAHAGHRGNWWALVTDNGKTVGRPVVQRKSDPAPGYYVSTTALYAPDNPNARDPHRYVDSARVPYVVL